MSTAKQTTSKTAKTTKTVKAAPKPAAAKTATARKPRARTEPGTGASAARKPGAKPAAAHRATVKPVKSVKPVKATAPATESPKQPKTKLVRDSFTMPKPEYLVIDSLKQRSAQAGRPLKKSEVLRAGVKALAAMGDAEFAAAIANVQTLKTGRPKSKKAAEAESQE